MNDTTQTIAALASGSSPAGVAVVRVSGPRVKEVLRALFQAKQDPTILPRMLLYGSILSHPSEEIIDHGLAVYMPGPESFTGEDVAEFQIHGSPLIAKQLLQSLFAFGILPAEAGEFTKRAFLNGKLDLIQAEAIGELISATSEAALQIASDNLSGKLSQYMDHVAEPLRDLLAEVEATLDFPEEDINPAQSSQMLSTLHEAKEILQQLHKTFSYGQCIREGYRILLCGPPNAGKSSLLNTLLEQPRAIVTEFSGTTRDLIEEECIIGNHRFVLCDSAGITETDNAVEKLGIELSLDRLGWADLVLLVIDASANYPELDSLTQMIGKKAKNVWMITNKIDLNKQAIGKYYCDGTICHQNFYLSAQTGDGLEALKEAFIEEIEGLRVDSSEASITLTQARQAHLILEAIDHLTTAEKLFELNTPLEIISEELRLSLHSLEEMVGKTYTDDILGRIFTKFCVGK